MNPSRDRILKRLSEAAGDTGERRVDIARPSGTNGSGKNLIGLFTAALEKVGGRVVTTSPDNLIGTLAELFPQTGRTFVGDDAGLDGPLPAGFSTDADPASCDAAITGCDALVAETGSVILSGGAGRRRISSLVTGTHCVVAGARQCVATLDEYLRNLSANEPAWSGTRSVLTMITGSSRTADIEKVLILGMHGPRELIVVIVS